MAFLVERYLPPAAASSLAASVARLARLCADLSRSGLGVKYLQSAYLPTEDTCFCLFIGPSSDAVREVNSQAHFAFDRITHAVLVLPAIPADLTAPTLTAPAHRTIDQTEGTP
jgi:hypothetical protein